MDLNNLKMIPGSAQPGEKARYYVWLPKGRDIGAPICEFDPVPLDAGVLSRYKAPDEVYLCYDEEDESRIPHIGKILEGNNVHRERAGSVNIDVAKATMDYRGSDVEGANWLMFVWR